MSRRCEHYPEKSDAETESRPSGSLLDDCMRTAKDRVAISDWTGALEALQTWDGRGPAKSEYYEILAQVLRSLKRDSDALAAIADGESAGRTGSLLVLKGKILRDRGDYEQAHQAFMKAIAIDPDFADAHCQIGILAQHRGDHESAMRACQHAVALDPTRGIHWLCLGKSYRHYEAWQVAETCFARAEEVFKADRSANRLYNMACLASVRGDIDRAYELFESFVGQHPYAFAWAEKDEDLTALRADPRFWTLFHLYRAYESGEPGGEIVSSPEIDS